MIESFPLSWPDHVQRTPKNKQKYSNFTCTIAQARNGVLAEISRLGGVNAIISSNVPTKKDGTLYANTKTVDGDNGIAVYFTWDKEQYVLACDQYVGLHENLRAIEKTIDAMRGIKRWGSSDILKRAFTGFKALPEHGKQWYEILNVDSDASIDVVVKAGKLLLKKYHPDNRETGDNDKFIEVNEAIKAFNLSVNA